MREYKRNKWILMFFTYGEGEEEEEEEEERSYVCCEIIDSMLFIVACYRRFYRWIIKY